MDHKTLERIAADLVEPSETDIATAYGIILQAAVDCDTPISRSEILTTIGQHLDLPGSPTTQVSMTAVSMDQLAGTPAILWARQEHAARAALSKLVAQGIVVPVEMPSNSSSRPSISTRSCPYYFGNSMANTTGTFNIPIGNYLVPTRFRLTPGLRQSGSTPLLTVEKWRSDVGDLLNDRLLRILDEALSALRRGAYLSAVILIGAVLEGAWYRAGSALRHRETRLAQALDNDRTATVQTEVGRILAGVPRMKAAAGDLQSFAGYVRSIRNYGIHPGATDEVAAEDSFTQEGAHLLIQRAHSHLVQLLAAIRKVDGAAFDEVSS